MKNTKRREDMKYEISGKKTKKKTLVFKRYHSEKFKKMESVIK